MSHRVAFFLGLVWVGFFAFDAVQNDWSWTMELSRNGINLISWIQFWH